MSTTPKPHHTDPTKHNQAQQLVDNTFIPRQNPKKALTSPKRARWVEEWGEIEEGTPVIVSWFDACGFAYDWEDEEEVAAADIEPTISIGLLLYADEYQIKIISIINTGTYGHGISIPTGCITNIQTLNKTA
jgi:hypothetical protein